MSRRGHAPPLGRDGPPSLCGVAETLSIQRIDLTNFRSFANAVLELDDRVTVLVADNGGGKTAALDALSIAVAALIPAVRGRRAKGARPQRGLDLLASDARSSEAMPPYRHSSFPVVIRGVAAVCEEETEWHVLLDGPDQPQLNEVPSAATSLTSARRLAELPPVDLPVVAHYGTARSTSGVHATKMPSLGRVNRSFGYKNGLASSANYAEITGWLAQTEWERTSARGTPWESVLNCVYEAATGVLAPLGVTAVFYSLEERDLVVEFKVGREERRALPMSMLSDGFRSVLALVADLAFRCGALNAHFDAEAAQLTDGLVLIDEIDMHLHPNWQARIVEDLVRTFPRIQFVLTTHSPLVVSSIDGSQVRKIQSTNGEGQITAQPRRTKGADIEYISEAIFEAPTRGDAEYASDLHLLSELLAVGDLVGAAAPAERVRVRLGDDADFDADRLLREFDWRRQRADDRE